MSETLTTLQNLFTVAFVVSSMLGMGLALTLGQILQPLRNGRLVLAALVTNFVIIPAVAIALARVIPMDEQLQIGVILFGSAAGAPFLPKLAQIAKASVAFSVGLMAMLIVVTVIFLPIVLPLVLPGVSVDARSMAVMLFGQMLVPLGIGLAVRQRFPEGAAQISPPIAQVASLSLVLLFVLMLGLNIESVIGLFGSGALAATAILLAVAIVSGYLLGGPSSDTRQVLALGTGQRNLAAAFLVATANFAEQPNVLVYLAGAGLIGMAILFPFAAELGKRKATPGGGATARADPGTGTAASSEESHA